MANAGQNTAVVAALTGDPEFASFMGKLFDRDQREQDRAREMMTASERETAKLFAESLVYLFDAVDGALETGRLREAERALRLVSGAAEEARAYL